MSTPKEPVPAPASAVTQSLRPKWTLARQYAIDSEEPPELRSSPEDVHRSFTNNSNNNNNNRNSHINSNNINSTTNISESNATINNSNNSNNNDNNTSNKNDNAENNQDNNDDDKDERGEVREGRGGGGGGGGGGVKEDSTFPEQPSDAAPENLSPTRLHVHSRDGNLETVERLVLSGESVNCQYREGDVRAITPLSLAVRRRRLGTAELLLGAGARVDACEEALSKRENAWLESYTALHWAAENGDEPMARLLLRHGADCNRRASLGGHRGVTPLHLAAQDGDDQMCRLLLATPGCLRDPVKSTPRRSAVTPLHQAAFNGHPDTVRLLLDAGCDPNRQADNGYAPLHYACQIGHAAMAEAILDRGGRHDLRSRTEVQSSITPLHLAVQSGDEATIRLLAGRGADLEAEKRLGRAGSETGAGSGTGAGVTPLHQAVHQDKLSVVRLLVSLGANAHAKSGGTWYTACHIAAERGNLEMTDFLLSGSAPAPASGSGSKEKEEGERAKPEKIKADPNARASLGDHGDVTPLHVASQNGRDGLIRRLVAVGADVSCVRRFGARSGITCLHLAVEFGHPETAQLLVNLGCDVDRADSLGYTPLHSAVQHRRPEVAKILLAGGRCDLGLRNAAGLTAKQMAKRSSNPEMVALFREAGKGKRKSSRKVKARRTKSVLLKYLCGL